MTIYFVRHGETVWNRAGRFQGRVDSPLTLQGVRLAVAYGEWLRAELSATAPITIYSSPLGRALQTATLLADQLEHPADAIQIDPLLAEADVGQLSGHTWPEVEARFGIVRGQVGRWDFRPPDGESGRDQFERARKWLDGARESPSIVVSHGGFSRFFRAAYLDLAPADIDSLESHVHGQLFRLSEGRAHRIPVAHSGATDSPILATR